MADDIGMGAPDLDADGIPDTCEPDCNSNGVPDDHDIALATSLDAHGHGVPDECEPDCNANPRPDYTRIHPDLRLDLHRGADLTTGATPLGMLKFEGIGTDVLPLVLGSTGGSIGETSGLVILVCGGYLALRRFLEWRIPVSIFATVGAFSGAL